MEEENKGNNEQNKKNKVILWAAIILTIIIIAVVLVMSIPEKESTSKVPVDSNKTIQIENKDTEKEEDKEKTKKEIKFSKNSVIISVGGSETLQILNDESRDLAWSSSHPNIATVDNAGIVTAVSMGTAVITGQKSDGSIGSCTIIVKGSSYSGDKNTEEIPDNMTDINQDYTQNVPDNTQNPNDDFNDWDSNNGDINNEQPDDPIIDEPIVDPIKYIVTFMLDDKIILAQELEEGLPINNIPENPSKYRIYI